MKNLRNILLAVIIFTACTEQPILIKSFDTESPGIKMFGRNNLRSFYINEFLGDSLELIWNSETKGSYGNFSPLIFDEYVLINDLGGNLTTFNRITGLKSGTNQFEGEIAVNPVIYAYKVFFVLNSLRENYSMFYSYDIIRGKLLSEYKIEGRCNNELIFSDGKLFILTTEGTLYKFNDVGFLLSTHKTDKLVQSDPAADDNYIYWANQSGEFVCVSLNNLKTIYSVKITDSFESGLTINDNKGYLSDIYGVVYSIDLRDGNIIWACDTGAKIRAHVVHDGKNTYGANLAGDYFSIDDKGNLLYKYNTGGVLNATPLVFKDYVVQPDLNEKVHLINKVNGEIVKSLVFERRVKMSPAYFDRTIYFGADRGQIYAYKTRGKK